METEIKKGIRYEVISHNVKDGKKKVYSSIDNRGKFVRNKFTQVREELKVAFEGLKFYHLGKTTGSPCKMVLKSQFYIT